MVNKCELCDREFSSSDALNMHNKSKHPEEVKKPIISSKHKKKIKNWFIVLVIIAFFGLIFFFVSDVKTLPPTTMQGHVEVNPPSHIMKIPMRIEVHKHMLEHADAIEGGRPGIIINYNCKDYECEEGLIEKLESFAIKYPKHVYVAPFKNMDAKIALTTLNQQKVLEEYNFEVIDNFVR